MNGNRYLLDTNCIIEILQKDNRELLSKLENADYIAVSIVSKIEFLAFPQIRQKDIELLDEFLEFVDVIDLQNENKEMINYIIEFKQRTKLKLPDSIILATSKFLKAILLTRDQQLLNSSYDFVEKF
ncbi:MAG: PIN domain-containing protein [Candidatus Cloacimonetes bacterium]|nr:PIN domain-containing protein [Candidatus Cloacimonadota bacterium]